MSIKLAGCSTLLVRAVEMDGTEVGMTAWAQMTASLLGMSDTLCVGRSDTLTRWPPSFTLTRWPPSFSPVDLGHSWR
jgi:hypothetical protein